MLNKILKFGLQAGKIYIEKRGIDGTIEDITKLAQLKKQFNARKQNHLENENNEDFDYDIMEQQTSDTESEMLSVFAEAKKHDITSSKFHKGANIALESGYAFINTLFDVDDSLDYLNDFAERIDSICDDILQYIASQCKGSINAPSTLTIGLPTSEFGMTIFGTYPVNFDYGMTLLVGVVINGVLLEGDTIELPIYDDDDNNECAKVSFIKMFGKRLASAEAGDLCAVILDGGYSDELPEEVFSIGNTTVATSEEDIHVNSNATIFTENEQVYMEEFRECYNNDGTISDKERRLLNRLRQSLDISETRASELEKLCHETELSENEKEYLEEFKACMDNDGKLSDRERRLLDRLALSLGIDTLRIKEIESKVTIGKK